MPDVESNVFVVPLKQINYIDFPELQLDKHESTEMPFRYVEGEDGQPVMPEVRFDNLSDPKIESILKEFRE